MRGCCGTAEGPRRVVLSCAGAYVAGPVNSNACPAGSSRIETEAACRTAVAAAGKFPGTPFVVSVSAEPGGCNFFTRSNIAYFNGVGVAGNPNAQLLCAAVVTAGAPPRAAGADTPAMRSGTAARVPHSPARDLCGAFGVRFAGFSTGAAAKATERYPLQWSRRALRRIGQRRRGGAGWA
jgi:hypothetical protein